MTLTINEFNTKLKELQSKYGKTYKIHHNQNGKGWAEHGALKYKGNEIYLDPKILQFRTDGEYSRLDGPAITHFKENGKVEEIYFLNKKRTSKLIYYKTCKFCDFTANSKEDLLVHYDEEEEKGNIIDSDTKAILNNGEVFNKKLSLEDKFIIEYNKHYKDINEKLEEIAKLMGEVEKICDKTGLPVSTDFSPISNTYTPKSFHRKFGKLDSDLIYEICNACPYSNDSYGWQYSAVC